MAVTRKNPALIASYEAAMAKAPNRQSKGASFSNIVAEDANARLYGPDMISPSQAATEAKATGAAAEAARNYGSYGGYSGGSADMTALIQSAYNEQKAALDQRLAAMQAERQAMYDRAEAKFREDYDIAAAQMNDNINRSLQEAYIAKMIGARDLNQMLTAQGISGGASETSTASLLNAYAGARNELELSRAQQMQRLLAALNDNLAGAYDTYASGNLSDLAAYYDSLVAAIGNRTNAQLSAASSSSGSGGGYDSRLIKEGAKAVEAAFGDVRANATSAANLLLKAGYTEDQAAAVLEKYI